MICLHCKKGGAIKEYPAKLYYGTASYRVPAKWLLHEECYEAWWNDLTWHLDTLDERMNANVHFQRIEGSRGTYKGKSVDASWNGLEARHFLGEYEFQHRRPHPCDGCSLR